MFSSLKIKILLGVYIFLMISIPAGAYFLAQQQTILKSSALEPSTKPTIAVVPSPTVSAAQQLQNEAAKLISSASPSPSPSPESAIATSYGPTLSFKVTLEGRPADNQATKLFVGIVEGAISINPKFLLSFTVDLPKNGQYSDVSLAGLTPGTEYTALLKGQDQIATSSAFIMSPAVTSLNNGNPLTMLSGDLNEDNTINSADYDIAVKAFGSTPTSSNWNENADLNKDGVVNSLDLGIISRNLGKIGASGIWTSPIPQVSTASADLNNQPPVGGLPDGTRGYWMWVPSQ